MVARINSGKSISRILNYNEHKVNEGVATCIKENNFLGKPDEMNFYDKLNWFNYYTTKNERVKTNCVHISLNFDVGEKLNKEKLSAISGDYMEKIGFGDQPYLVYEHQDAAHPHIHIITTNVQLDGKRIDIHNIGKEKSEKARKEIEEQYKLVKAESKDKKQKLEYVKPFDLKKATYGKSEVRRSISTIISSITSEYKYTSLPELNAILRNYNVQADRGKEGSRVFENKGLYYSIIDKRGKKLGVPIKASLLYNKPTLKFLERQFKLNEILRRPHKEALKGRIDSVFKTKPSNAKEFRRLLDSKGIQIVERKNSQGRIYGITFIDHASRCVFNGSDLGKDYSAKGILEKLSDIKKSLIFSPGYSQTEGLNSNQSTQYQKPTLPAEQLFKELTIAEQQEYQSPEAAMKLRKKRRRRGRSI